jgi:hypothetical protein
MPVKVIEYLIGLPSVRAWLIAHGWKPPAASKLTGGGGGPQEPP